VVARVIFPPWKPLVAGSGRPGMAETRVNLRHLLEDLRDAYPVPPEEVIVTELVANALDSGARSIRFLVSPAGRTMTLVDDGRGMTRPELAKYHDIAATTKVRGRGIGFAGVGVKIALLLAEAVVTETKRGRNHAATRWSLETPQRAPWRRARPDGLVTTRGGTAVTILLSDPASPLVRPDYLTDALHRHFAPLLDDDICTRLLDSVYGKRVSFSVNGESVTAPSAASPGSVRPFTVRMGARSRLVGAGRLFVAPGPVPEESRGLAVSTYGKVIKRGWEWLGIAPLRPDLVCGLVEAPMLASLLTISKADFLRDGPALWKFYGFRRAVQRALEPLLAELGERREEPPAGKPMREAVRELNRALGGLAGEYPALAALLGVRFRGPVPGAEGEGGPGEREGVPEEGPSGAGAVEAAPSPQEGAAESVPEKPQLDAPEGEGGRRPGGGLSVEYEDRPDREEPAWLADGIVRVNRAHPAFTRAVAEKAEGYHLAFAAAWAIARHLDAAADPGIFVNRFMRKWGSGT